VTAQRSRAGTIARTWTSLCASSLCPRQATGTSFQAHIKTHTHTRVQCTHAYTYTQKDAPPSLPTHTLTHSLLLTHTHTHTHVRTHTTHTDTLTHTDTYTHTLAHRLIVEHTENKLEFNIPRDAAQGYVNNQRENYNFRFNGIIAPEAKQDEVGLKSQELF